MDNYNSILSTARIILNNKLDGKNPTEEDIKEAVVNATMLFPVTDKIKEDVEKTLQASFKVRLDLGTSVLDESTYHPWLDSRKAQIDPYYWKRYKTYLVTIMGWDEKVVDKLGEVSDDILDLCGNPAEIENWKRKGLIIGDIQSGKTSNYLALCNKAADAGYKVIILLAGMMENLRKQTQERVDSGFAGLNSRTVLQRNPEKKYVGVGEIDSNRIAYQFTNVLTDFNSGTLQSLGFTIAGFKEPVIFVVKKNKTILDNLKTWLATRNTSTVGAKIDLPLLLIDDEADNASINTSKPEKSPTAINNAIVDILRLFTHSTYIGVTATPFANIFIDPDLDRGTDEFNLFPSDFIYALSAPTNYIGADQIFGENATYAQSLNTINDVVVDPETGETVFRSKSRSEHIVPFIPGSLKTAIRYFLLVNCVRDLDGRTTTHRSMLINVSQYVKVQQQVYEQVDVLLKDIKNEVQSYSKTGIKALKHKEIAALKKVWDEENLSSKTRYSWEEIQNTLYESVAPIVIRLVNQKSKAKGVESLDYGIRKDTGLRVIAVGGNSLSRGLTLEGLIVSYFDRNSQMYDTLMQMGRWFGYRTGYEKLFKIWMEPDAIDWYQYITDASDELKRDINDMRKKGLRPVDFGLKVQQNKTSLFVTAANKRRATTPIEQFVSLAAEVVETPRLIADKEKCLRINLELTTDLLNKLIDKYDEYYQKEYNFTNNRVVFTHVPNEYVASYVEGFVSHPKHIPFNARDLSEYIRNANEEWTVAVIGGRLEQTLEKDFFGEKIANLNIRYSSRVISRDGSCLSILGKRARVGTPGATKCGLTEKEIEDIETRFKSNPDNATKKTIPDKPYLEGNRNPVLLIYVLKIDKEKNSKRRDNSNNSAIDLIGDYPVVAIELGFPGQGPDKGRKVKYILNRVAERQMLYYVDDLDEDDED